MRKYIGWCELNSYENIFGEKFPELACEWTGIVYDKAVIRTCATELFCEQSIGIVLSLIRHSQPRYTDRQTYAYVLSCFSIRPSTSAPH